MALLACLYRHFVMSSRVAGNQLSPGNYLETLAIIAFLSFAIGLYWRSESLPVSRSNMAQVKDAIRRLR